MGGFAMKTPRKSRNFGTATHKDLGLRFDIVGAKTTTLGPCFVVIEENDLSRRERIFHADKFDREDFPSVVRDALFLELAEKESKRVKLKLQKEAANERARDRQVRAESDVEDERLEREYQDLEDEPLEPIEDSEVISDEDTEGHEPLPELEEEFVDEE
jgi:hypothetical protein